MARRMELDALRGLLLLVMALTHLPTRVSVYASQPLGFVSAAEGFVFLSAFLAGSSYTATLVTGGATQLRTRAWGRALTLYGYHLWLLLFAFTIAAAFAALTGRPALRNLLTFYFDAPVIAIISGSLLLYQPPLFDILPMYIVFLALTPVLLTAAERYGWRNILILSALGWLFAQVGGRQLLYDTVPSFVGLRFPMEAGGSFDLFAWQLLWVGGVWFGARARTAGRAPLPAGVVAGAVAVATAFLLWRHGSGMASSALGFAEPLLDKWRLGPLRILNFAAIAIVVSQLALRLFAWVHLSVLTLLGRASLQAFCAHLLVCVASLGLIVDDGTPLTLAQEIVVLAVTLAVMLFVARRVAVVAARTRRPIEPSALDGG